MTTHKTSQPAPLAIPAFLLVKNRDKFWGKPGRGKKAAPAATGAATPPPPSCLEAMSPEARAWVERELAARRFHLHWLDDDGTVQFIEDKVVVREAARAAATADRVAGLEAEHGHKSKRALRAALRAAKPKKPRREEMFAPRDAYVIKVLAKKNPCKAGTAAHDVFKKYKSGQTVAAFEKAAAGACPGKLRPVDYLIYDSRKGRIAVEPKGGAK